MRIHAYGKSDIGNRETNEDRMVIDTQIGLLAVADGMGGHAAGEVAAELAVTGIRRYIHDHSWMLEEAVRLPEAHQVGVDLMVDAMEDVCREVHSVSKSDPHCFRMGTTMTAALMLHSKLVVSHVGDSRLYHCRGDRVQQVTRDHTLEAELTREGLDIAQAGLAGRFTHMLTRVVGQKPPIAIDQHVLDIHADDWIVLCTDGLSNYVQCEEELAGLLAERDCEQAGWDLVKMAKQRGGSDDVSVIVARLSPANGRESETPRRVMACRK